MPDQLAEIRKSIDGVSRGLVTISKVVGELNKTQKKAPEQESRRVVVDVDPLASWAVEKRRQRAEERAAELERQWRHDRTMTWIAAIAGLAGAVIGAVLTVALTYWLLPK